MRNEIELVENKDLRNEMIDKVQVLDKVKCLVLLPNDLGATTEMVANYFEVPVPTIKSVILEHKEELNENGLTLRTRKNLLRLNQNLKTKRGGFDILDENNNILASGSNKGIRLFTRRTILNVAMLLRDSVVAKEIRRVLLDTMEDKSAIETTVNNISEEQLLQLAIINADTPEESMLALANYKRFKEKHVIELQNTIEEMKPDADLGKLISNSQGNIDMNAMAKILSNDGINIGRNKLFKFLKDEKVLMNNNQPYQTYVDRGHFKLIEVSKNDMIFIKPLITPKGQKFIVKLINEKYNK